jgi:hypothetical protein
MTAKELAKLMEDFLNNSPGAGAKIVGEIARLKDELAKAREDAERLDALVKELEIGNVDIAEVIEPDGACKTSIDTITGAYSGYSLRDALRDLRDRNEDAADLAEAEQALREVDESGSVSLEDVKMRITEDGLTRTATCGKQKGATDAQQEQPMLKIPSTVDAMEWAESFVAHKIANKWTIDDIDEGLMVGWFANFWAIMERGTDAPNSTPTPSTLNLGVTQGSMWSGGGVNLEQENAELRAEVEELREDVESRHFLETPAADQWNTISRAFPSLDAETVVKYLRMFMENDGDTMEDRTLRAEVEQLRTRAEDLQQQALGANSLREDVFHLKERLDFVRKAQHKAEERLREI